MGGEERALEQETLAMLSVELSIASLEKQRKDGCITKQEYDAKVGTIIRTLLKVKKQLD